MEALLNECIVACETCCADCLCSKRHNMNDCVRLCMVCERVCKALKVAMKCGADKEVLNCLVRACHKCCR